MEHLVAAAGILVFIALAWAGSRARGQFPWRTVIAGLVLDLVLGLVAFRVPAVRTAFLWANDVVDAAYGASLDGARFLFGPLAIPPGEPGSLGVILACQVLPVTIVISALMALAYRLHLLQPLVGAFARLFHRTMRVSGAESVSAAANIFTGVESALVVQPYLARMTDSEFLVVLTCGMATVASNVLGLYALALEQVFPGAAGHLVMASVIAIPASIIAAKVLLPEQAVPETLGRLPPAPPEEPGGWMGAVIDGSMAGLRLVAGLGACLIALLGLVALADRLLALGGHAVGSAHGVTLVQLASLPFYPLAWLMGVPAADVGTSAHLLGERLILTEFVSYQDLAHLAKTGQIHDPRTLVILAYALCGFAHIASVAIFVGGTAALVPSRKHDLARLGLRALVAATLATLITGAFAGVCVRGDETTLPRTAATAMAAPALPAR